MTVTITFEVPPALIEDIHDRRDRVERGLEAAVDDLLDFVEKAQVHAYTSSASPAQPPGSTYERTFTLRRSSKKRRTGRFSGIWETDEGIASYDRYVIGKRSEQANIHRGRWKSTQEVEQELEREAPKIIEAKIK